LAKTRSSVNGTRSREGADAGRLSVLQIGKKDRRIGWIAAAA
jgi:hypothetical protein